jgi:steroid delta-isomerase
MARWLMAIVAVLAGVGATTAACADMSSDKAAITERLEHWTAAFNARDAAGVCDLFSPELIYTIPEVRNGNREELCTRLGALLAKTGLQLRYETPDIREIIISGNIAVVRLFWTLTARKGTDHDTSTEAGMDIFKRQPDGKWFIVRFISFSMTPNKILQ